MRRIAHAAEYLRSVIVLASRCSDRRSPVLKRVLTLYARQPSRWDPDASGGLYATLVSWMVGLRWPDLLPRRAERPGQTSTLSCPSAA